MKSSLLLKNFLLIVIASILFCVFVNFAYCQVINSPVKSVPTKVNITTSAKLTSAELQNTLLVRTNEDAEYCDFVIHCNESGIIPTRILHFAYRKALNAERNQRFERFQKNLEYICEHEKINLKPDKTKTKKTNFSIFKTSAIQSIFRFK